MDAAQFDRALSGHVNKMRDEQGLSIETLGAQAGIAYTTLHRRLNHGGFTLPELFDIARCFNTSVAALVIAAEAGSVVAA